MAIVFKDFSRDVSVTPAVQLGVMPRVLFVILVMANLRMSKSKSTPNIVLMGFSWEWCQEFCLWYQWWQILECPNLNQHQIFSYGVQLGVMLAVWLGVMPRVLFVILVIANLRMSESKWAPNIVFMGFSWEWCLQFSNFYVVDGFLRSKLCVCVCVCVLLVDFHGCEWRLQLQLLP